MTQALADVTPLLLTFNEAENIDRSLSALSWARSIVVIDSGSTDDTLAILGRHPRVTVVHRAFDDHTTQWNFGLDQIRTTWALTLDADYIVTDEFIDEMTGLVSQADADGYFAPFTYWIEGKPLRASLYPPRMVLFRRECGRYVEDGHTQVLRLNGRAGRMQSRIRHDDRKPLARWLEAQRRYAALEVDKLRRSAPGALSRNDRIRRLKFAAPILAFLYCLFARGAIFDGRRGVYYAFQRMFAELLLSLHLFEAAFRGDSLKS